MTDSDGNAEPYITQVADLAWNKRPKHRYRCSGTSDVAHLGKVRCSNGAIQYKAFCPECRGKGTDIQHIDVAGLDEDRIPFLAIHDAVACERCGSVDGSEVHHWAPFHLFEDADEWPTSYLCRACHMQWHSVVTPTMSNTRSAA